MNVLLTIRSGRRTPIDEIPTPAFAVPYAAPKQVKTMALVQPIAPKNGYLESANPFSTAALSSHIPRLVLSALLPELSRACGVVVRGALGEARRWLCFVEKKYLRHIRDCETHHVSSKFNTKYCSQQ